MSGAPFLAAVGAAILLWPRPPVYRRLPVLTTRTGVSRQFDLVWLVLVLPIGALLGFGVAAGVAAGLVSATRLAIHRRAARRAQHEARDGEVRRALAIMIAELSVGAPMVHACRSAADELSRAGPSDVAAELSRMAARAELGGEPVDGGVGLDRLATAWAASDGRGLPMIDLLAAVRADLVARADFTARTRAGLAGPRASAMVLALLPLLGIALGQAMGASPVRVLLSPGLGGILLVVGTGLAVAGVWWTVAITERVLR